MLRMNRLIIFTAISRALLVDSIEAMHCNERTKYSLPPFSVVYPIPGAWYFSKMT